MDLQAIYSFLFESYAGIGVLVASALVLSIIVAVIMEWNTRRTFVDRGPADEEDDWSFFDDDDKEEGK